MILSKKISKKIISKDSVKIELIKISGKKVTLTFHNSRKTVNSEEIVDKDKKEQQ